MNKRILTVAAFLGAVAVLLGAFAAHGLKAVLPEQYLAIFETGVRYQFYHVFALLVVGILYKEFGNRWLRWSSIFLVAGVACFSGSLYLLAFMQGIMPPGFQWLFLITPLGGLCFILGWLLLAIGLSLKK